jgi:hypothetical protein
MKSSKLERERNARFLTGRGKRNLKHRTTRETDSFAARCLLISFWLGFVSYVSLAFATIPRWLGLTRDAWLTITLAAFGGALSLLFKALPVFGQSDASKSNESSDE